MKAFKMFFKEVDPSISYDPEELKLGIEVEREHTNYKAIATIIAKQHLAEDPHYYSKLKTTHSEDAEDIHKPVRPGILKRAAGGGKLTCAKAKQVKAKQKNKGNNTAKAAQRFCNYRGCEC
jgi:hypothetical protein